MGGKLFLDTLKTMSRSSLVLALVGIPWMFCVGGIPSFAFFYTEGPPRGNTGEVFIWVLVSGAPGFVSVVLGWLAIRGRHRANQSIALPITGFIIGILEVALLTASAVAMIRDMQRT